MEKADVPTVAAALAALLVAAEGEIKDAEKALAIELGNKMFPGFSPLVLDTLLEGMETVPSAGELASSVSGLLDDAGKSAIMEYLVALAQADDQIACVEKAHLAEVAQALGLEVPALCH